MPRGRDLARHLAARRRCIASMAVEHAPVVAAGRAACGERDRQRPAGRSAIVRRTCELVVDVDEVGHDLQHARAGLADRRWRCRRARRAAAVSVGVGSPLLVRWFSVRDVVKPSAPAVDAVGGEAPISAISSAVAGLAVGAALAHHVEAQRAVGTWAATSMS